MSLTKRDIYIYFFFTSKAPREWKGSEPNKTLIYKQSSKGMEEGMSLTKTFYKQSSRSGRRMEPNKGEETAFPDFHSRPELTVSFPQESWLLAHTSHGLVYRLAAEGA